MSPRAFIAFVVAAIIAFGGGMALWVLVQPRAETEAPAATSTSEAERNAHRERFFGGDPDRDVRSGQEMKPRW